MWLLSIGTAGSSLDRVADDDGEQPPPQVVPLAPGPDALFIDWPVGPAACVCLPAEMSGRRLLTDGDHLFATAVLDVSEPALW